MSGAATVRAVPSSRGLQYEGVHGPVSGVRVVAVQTVRVMNGDAVAATSKATSGGEGRVDVHIPADRDVVMLRDLRRDADR